ncbi:GNAT family N-acetyltransferase [Actinomycetospora sp. TBRC 11914]|uniref:GNAT family N-acetyltransferase n=1 Tax=Actinomycetospora sp. TBRC 11914 TaxID=2729387 RepID=UPI00145F30ED|nr:GNAT family N-acetyltransferase [Actinomycetospora sp. TBRC 11914]NMO88395.1 GNAT family N-acetyltransferase [Actinomycetospora sp. TBRC 11914]
MTTTTEFSGTARATDGEPPVRWTTRWETSLEPREHDDIAALLARSYASTTTVFTHGHSWAGARPELRILGHHRGEVVAHAAVIRRFLRAPDHDTSVLVGDVGLVAVDPDRQGLGLGGALMDTVAATLRRLGLPYGFLTCGREVRGFYRRCGWTPLSDHALRSISIDLALEDHRHNGMLLPVHRSADEWPSGPIERNGQEI